MRKDSSRASDNMGCYTYTFWNIANVKECRFESSNLHSAAEDLERCETRRQRSIGYLSRKKFPILLNCFVLHVDAKVLSTIPPGVETPEPKLTDRTMYQAYR